MIKEIKVTTHFSDVYKTEETIILIHQENGKSVSISMLHPIDEKLICAGLRNLATVIEWKNKMGTTENPGKYDCYNKALPDEPKFTLLARDPDFARLINLWADKRMADIKCGDRPREDVHLVTEARNCALTGAEWRRENLGKWRK